PVAIERSAYETLKAANNEIVATFTETESSAAAYKRMYQNGSLSATKGTTTKLEGVTNTFTTDSVWGDYQMNFTGLEMEGTVYGVIIKTTDGAKYGLRHLENIWKKGAEISWSSGIKTVEAKGNKLSYEHYASMMGKTIAEVTWITDAGIYTVSDLEQYVPVKYNGTFEIADADLAAGATTYTINGFPEDGNWQLELPEGLKGASYANRTISFGKETLPGSYTVTAKDANNKYAETSTSFNVKTDKLPVEYKDGKVVGLENTAEEAVSNYIKNIASVNVKFGETTKTYKASGKGSVAIIAEDGTVKMDAASKGTEVFAEAGSYELTVVSNGYPELAFTVEKKAVVPTQTATPIPTKAAVPTKAVVPTKAATPTPKAKVTAPKKVTVSKVSNVKGKKLKVKWKKVSGANGYQIVIATNKKFTKGKKTYTIKKASTTSKTITGLKKNKTYYVRVRAYNKSGSTKKYGKYSTIKKVKIKK
ncbi:MAG: fibronectin type III domain-containing protein, partial [Clostridia bacterium]|nr:fibronectin type III domain-containing protein [Clostridia bacterium]